MSAALVHGPMASQRKMRELTMNEHLTTVIPTAICSALDVGLSVASLHHISLSFYTIVKSAVPVWVLLFAFTFRLERVGLTAAGEVHFSMIGFILIQSSAISSGLRWCLTQLMLQRGQGSLGDPIATIYRLSPAQFVALCIASYFSETGKDGFMSSPYFATWSSTLSTLALISAGGLVALLMTLSQFALVNATGVVTLSVTGIFKVIFMIIVSTIFFGDTVSYLGMCGVVMSTLGVAAYTGLKMMNHKRKENSYNKLSKD
ncbi:Triose-phosphate Transporter [Phlyctochytrium planicorne]|nr:Triose-phosphate Transporter [Phlyctochytrium planicorne]